MQKGIFLCWAMAVGGLVGWAGAAPEIELSASAGRPTITVGEPLFVTVTLTNPSARAVYVRSDLYAFERIIWGPDGAQIPLNIPAPPPDYAYFPQALARGKKKMVSLAVIETTRIKRPGEYRMLLKDVGSQASTELRFQVEPYNEPELQARAEEIYRAAADLRSDEGGVHELALAAIDPAISQPFLCDLLRSNQEVIVSAQKLGELADAKSIDCLLKALPNSRGTQKEVLKGTLEQLAQRTSDTGQRDRIIKALRSQ